MPKHARTAVNAAHAHMVLARMHRDGCDRKALGDYDGDPTLSGHAEHCGVAATKTVESPPVGKVVGLGTQAGSEMKIVARLAVKSHVESCVTNRSMWKFFVGC